MFIVDKPRVFKGNEIIIPLYHRGHLSFLPGTKVFICLLPGSESHKHFPEIIISPIDCNVWKDVWRLTITVKEGIGAVNKVFRVLTTLNINILASESCSTDREEYHMIEIILDASKYSNIPDGNTEYRARNSIGELSYLRRAILSETLQDIYLWPSGAPRINIRRVKGLFEAAKAYDSASTNFSRKHDYTPVIDYSNIEPFSSGKYPTAKIRLSNEIMGLLDKVIKGKTSKDAPSMHLLISDTKDRYLRVQFVLPETSILSVTIEHKEKRGALTKITHVLGKAGFNILTSLSRLFSHNGISHYELVLQPPSGLGTDRNRFRKVLEEALGTEWLLDDFDIKINYKKSYKPLTGFNSVKKCINSQFSMPEINGLDVGKSLLGHYRFLTEKLGPPGATKDTKKRWELSISLLEEERRVRFDLEPVRILFISYAFDDQGRLEKVKEEAKKMNFEVLTGKNENLSRNVRDGVINTIKKCTHFMGIWTDEGALRVNEQFWPSPWLHWEIGVAESNGLKPRILISKKIHKDAWIKVYPELPHEIFQPGEFEDNLRLILDKLRREH
jgi:acetolactate synthase small subunit